VTIFMTTFLHFIPFLSPALFGLVDPDRSSRHRAKGSMAVGGPRFLPSRSHSVMKRPSKSAGTIGSTQPPEKPTDPATVAGIPHDGASPAQQQLASTTLLAHKQSSLSSTPATVAGIPHDGAGPAQQQLASTTLLAHKPSSFSSTPGVGALPETQERSIPDDYIELSPDDQNDVPPTVTSFRSVDPESSPRSVWQQLCVSRELFFSSPVVKVCWFAQAFGFEKLTVCLRAVFFVYLRVVNRKAVFNSETQSHKAQTLPWRSHTHKHTQHAERFIFHIALFMIMFTDLLLPMPGYRNLASIIMAWLALVFLQSMRTWVPVLYRMFRSFGLYSKAFYRVLSEILWNLPLWLYIAAFVLRISDDATNKSIRSSKVRCSEGACGRRIHSIFFFFSFCWLHQGLSG
jgi:hypothetical protein